MSPYKSGWPNHAGQQRQPPLTSQPRPSSSHRERPYRFSCARPLSADARGAARDRRNDREACIDSSRVASGVLGAVLLALLLVVVAMGKMKANSDDHASGVQTRLWDLTVK